METENKIYKQSEKVLITIFFTFTSIFTLGVVVLVLFALGGLVEPTFWKMMGLYVTYILLAFLVIYFFKKIPTSGFKDSKILPIICLILSVIISAAAVYGISYL